MVFPLLSLIRCHVLWEGGGGAAPWSPEGGSPFLLYSGLLARQLHGFLDLPEHSLKSPDLGSLTLITALLPQGIPGVWRPSVHGVTDKA